MGRKPFTLADITNKRALAMAAEHAERNRSQPPVIDSFKYATFQFTNGQSGIGLSTPLFNTASSSKVKPLKDSIPELLLSFFLTTVLPFVTVDFLSIHRASEAKLYLVEFLPIILTLIGFEYLAFLLYKGTKEFFKSLRNPKIGSTTSYNAPIVQKDKPKKVTYLSYYDLKMKCLQIEVLSIIELRIAQLEQPHFFQDHKNHIGTSEVPLSLPNDRELPEIADHHEIINEIGKLTPFSPDFPEPFQDS